jgi:hypothetical protein
MGIHLRVVKGTGLMGDGWFCLDCGLDKYPEAWPGLWPLPFRIADDFHLAKEATDKDWEKINEKRKEKR